MLCIVYSFVVSSWLTCNVSCGIGSRHRDVKCKIYLEFSKTEITLPESQCPGEIPLDTEVCFGKDCDGNQVEMEYMTDEQKTNVELSYQVLDHSTYFWREAEFTKCSHACLGGKSFYIYLNSLV